jgi:hypothetical protein
VVGFRRRFLGLGVEPLDDLLEQGREPALFNLGLRLPLNRRAYIIGAGALFRNLLLRRAVELRLAHERRHWSCFFCRRSITA